MVTDGASEARISNAKPISAGANKHVGTDASVTNNIICVSFEEASESRDKRRGFYQSR